MYRRRLSISKRVEGSFDIVEFEKEVNLYNKLLGVQLVCLTLFEMVDDTMKPSGIDAMGSESEVYASLKSSAKSNASTKAIINEIGERFGAQNRPRAKKEAYNNNLVDK